LRSAQSTEKNQQNCDVVATGGEWGAGTTAFGGKPETATAAGVGVPTNIFLRKHISCEIIVSLSYLPYCIWSVLIWLF
jgi:hypothetical protein